MGWQELATSARLVDPAYPGLTDANGFHMLPRNENLARVLWVDRAFGRGHLGRVEGARCNIAQEAEHNGLLNIRRTHSAEEASEALQLAKHGVEPIDAIVTELHVGRNPQAGLALLQLLDS